MIPSVFVSHGAPTLPLDDCPAREFLKGLGAKLPRPFAVLAVSAHWDTEKPTVNRVSVNDTIHDFAGFPAALYKLRYPAHGSRALVTRTRRCWEMPGLWWKRRNRGLAMAPGYP
jgi:4,5-DOPA dioxygenase extradiol